MVTENSLKNLEKNKGKGRPRGVKNKTTIELKEAVLKVYDKLGGDKGLLAWAESSPDNLKLFYSQMLTRMLPKYSDVNISGTVTHDIAGRLLRAQDRAKQLHSMKPAENKLLSIGSSNKLEPVTYTVQPEPVTESVIESIERENAEEMNKDGDTNT